MGYPEFKEEFRRLVSIRTPVQELAVDTSMEGLDSMGIVELCVAAEEELKLELEFKEVRTCKTYGELQDLLSVKGYGP